MQFENKIAVVTGAGGGIGEGYATRIAQEGATVVVVDLNEEGGQRVVSEIEAKGGKAVFQRCDVASVEDAAKLAAFIDGKFDGLDFLVNNAAIFADLQYVSLMTVDLAYYDKVQRVNMTSPLIMTRALAPLMQKRGGGSIVNQTSTAAWVRNGGFYGVFKLGLNGITTNLAMELGDLNIRVNAIAPGPTDTAGLRKVPKEMIDAIIQTNAIKRVGATNDMASAAVFLLSDQASWITGQVLCVDGGFMMRP
jgi:3-oxoacyl-[acyl-carrier protein] reductase